MAHILIVDESHTVRRVLGAILEQAHHEVQEAVDGRQAMQILLATPESLTVLLDEQIPLIDGWQLLRLMTAEGRLAPTDHYIFMTRSPHSLPPALLGLLRHLAIAILCKPFAVEQLLKLLDQEQEYDPQRLGPRRTATAGLAHSRLPE